MDSLEGRQLMAYSAFGFSRPDLTVEGYAPPAASYGSTVSLVLDVRNLGASSIREPLAFFDSRATTDPTVTRYQSTADAPANEIRVYLSPNPKFDPFNVISLGDISTPEIRQNSLVRLLQDASAPPNTLLTNVTPNVFNTAPTVTIPALDTLPANFPDSGTLYLFFEIDPNRTLAEHDETNNRQRQGVPIQIVDAQGQFEAVGLDVARGMAPGDLIAPNLKIINYGTVDVDPSPLTVDLVQSDDNQVDSSDTTIATYQINSVQPVTTAPTKKIKRGLKNLDDPANVTTVLASTSNPVNPTGPNVRLPNALRGYKFGAAVDPQNTVNELGEPNRVPANRITQFRRVGSPLRGVGPVNQVATPATRPLNFPRRTLPV